MTPPNPTDARIRAYRNTLFGAAYDYHEWLICQIALGNREPIKMTRDEAREHVARAIARKGAL